MVGVHMEASHFGDAKMRDNNSALPSPGTIQNEDLFVGVEDVQVVF